MTTVAKKRFLVVDDDPTLRELMFEILSDEGYAVDLAGDGREALQRLKDNHYNLIISDVNMPEMDGISLYSRIKEDFPGLEERVLFLTCVLTDEVLVFFRENGCKYLTKPFRVLDLLGQINTMLGR